MRIILFLLVGWYTIGNIQAQIKEPVKFKNELKMTSETEAEIVFTASIEKGWHVYSTGLGDDGPISATFNINASSHVETVGKLQPVGKEISIYDKMFEMNVRYFEDTVQFIQKVRFTGNDYFIEGFLEFGACNDESCLPPTQIPFQYGKKAEADIAVAKEEEERPANVLEKQSESDLWKPVINELLTPISLLVPLIIPNSYGWETRKGIFIALIRKTELSTVTRYRKSNSRFLICW